MLFPPPSTLHSPSLSVCILHISLVPFAQRSPPTPLYHVSLFLSIASRPFRNLSQDLSICLRLSSFAAHCCIFFSFDACLRSLFIFSVHSENAGGSSVDAAFLATAKKVLVFTPVCLSLLAGRPQFTDHLNCTLAMMQH